MTTARAIADLMTGSDGHRLYCGSREGLRDATHGSPEELRYKTMLLRLLHFCDSLFPIGSFGYSDGLEGAIASPRQLGAWIDVCLHETIGRLDGPTVFQAHRACDASDWDALATIDRESIALRPASSARKSSRAMGSRLLTAWSALHPDPRLARALSLAQQRTIAPSLPVAFAAVSVASAVDARAAAQAFAYTRLAATVSAAMRLVPIGQAEAHHLLARALDDVPAVVDALCARDRAAESFAPRVDIAVMSHQYLHARLFRT